MVSSPSPRALKMRQKYLDARFLSSTLWNNYGAHVCAVRLA